MSGNTVATGVPKIKTMTGSLGLGTGNRSKTDNNIVVGYSPTDFFYVDAMHRGEMPTPEQCTAMKPYDPYWDLSCNADHITDNSGVCLQKELCKNRDSAEWLVKSQNVYAGTDAKYSDTLSQYNQEWMFTINLGIGLLFVSGLIYKNVG